jgi:hypothetical protein
LGCSASLEIQDECSGYDQCSDGAEKPGLTA